MKRTIAALLAVLLFVAVGGCDLGVGKKGGPMARESERAERVRLSPQWTYRHAYMAWQVNHRTMQQQLEQAIRRRNNLLIKSAAEDASWALKSMQANLPEGKAKQLDPVVEQYRDLGEKAVRGVASPLLSSRLRQLAHQVTSGFDPDVVPIVPPREE